MTNATPFTELFPVQVDKLPTLHAYETIGGPADPREAAQLARTLDGRWAVTDGGLMLGDSDIAPDGYAPVKKYKPEPLDTAGYVIGALVPPLSDNLYQALQTPLNGNFRVMQRPLLKAWAVDGEPAISIGLAQSLIHKQTLADYAGTIPDVRGLVKMTVLSRSPLTDYRLVQGVVAGVTGTVGEHREKLARFARTKRALKRVNNAPDNEPVVQVMTPFGIYEYAASELYITLSPKDYARLRVDAGAAKKANYQNIDARARGVAAASAVLKAMDYIGDAYRADKFPASFLSAADIGFSATVQLGDHTPRPYAPAKLWAQIKDVGIFGIREGTQPLRIGVLSALGTAPPDRYDAQLIDAVKALGIPIADVQTVTAPGLSPDELERAFKLFEPAEALIVFLPGRAPSPTAPDDDWAAFRRVKEAAFRAGMGTLSLWEAGLKSPPREKALTFATMFGHAPFALGEPLPFTDFVAGLVYTPSASVSVVFQANGIFIGYILQVGALDEQGAAKLLPEAFFKGTRLLVQTTDALPETAVDALKGRAKGIDVKLKLGTVGPEANPNLYTFADKKVRQPSTGSSFLLGKADALLVSASPPHPAAPVNPVRVIADGRLKVQQAMQATLAMNLIHPTARKPRMPFHLHYAPALRQLLRAGVLPPTDEGASCGGYERNPGQQLPRQENASMSYIDDIFSVDWMDQDAGILLMQLTQPQPISDELFKDVLDYLVATVGGREAVVHVIFDLSLASYGLPGDLDIVAYVNANLPSNIGYVAAVVIDPLVEATLATGLKFIRSGQTYGSVVKSMADAEAVIRNRLNHSPDDYPTNPDADR